MGVCSSHPKPMSNRQWSSYWSDHQHNQQIQCAALREQEEAKKQQEWDNLTPEEQAARVSAYHMRLLEEVCESLCLHGLWLLPSEIEQQRKELSDGMKTAEAALALIRNECSNTHRILTHYGNQLRKYPDFSKITGDVRYVLQWISNQFADEIMYL